MNSSIFANPPAYTTSSSLEDSTPLPRYSRRPIFGSTTIHAQSGVKKFSFTKKSGLVLSVFGDAALSHRFPTFMEGGCISGAVTIGPQLEKRVKGASVSARGRIIIGHGRENRDGTIHTFLYLPVHLPPPGEERYGAIFCIPLPREVFVASGRRSSVEVARLPSSFAESRSPVCVVYDLVLKVKRNWWQRDLKLKAVFGYLQGSTRPLPSYMSNGWKSLDPVTLKGKIFREREIEVDYALSLSTPLCYNRGSAIHCYMVVKSDDEQALALLSHPTALVVNLERHVRYRNLHMHAANSVQWLSAVDHIEAATWRPSRRRGPESTRRFFKGEIRLRHDLSPSMRILNMAIEYMITMRAFRGAGFQPADKRKVDLLSEPVEITTSLYAWPTC